MSTRPRSLLFIALALLAAMVLLLPGCATGPSAEELARINEEKARQEEQARLEAEAEARRRAEQARIAEQQRQLEELQDLFGPVGEPPPAPGARQEPIAAAPAAPAAPAEAGAAPGAAPPAPGAAPAAPEAAPPARGTAAEFAPFGEPAPFVRHLTGAGTPAPGPAGTIPYDDAVPPLPAEPVLRVVILSHGAPLERGRQVAVQLGTHARERLEEQLGMAVQVVYVAQTARPLARPSEVRHRPELLRAAQVVAQELASEQWLGPLSEEEATQQGVDLVVHIGPAYR